MKQTRKLTDFSIGSLVRGSFSEEARKWLLGVVTGYHEGSGCLKVHWLRSGPWTFNSLNRGEFIFPESAEIVEIDND